MEKIMVIIFKSERDAHKGIQVLKRLDAEGSISIHSGALLRKKEDGSIEAPTYEDFNFPVEAMTGSMLGAVIGALAGPSGVVAGAGMGALAGVLGDAAVGSVDRELVDEMTSTLAPGTIAVLADVSEEWVTPVDTDLERYTKAIFRRPKVEVEDELISKRIEATETELEAMEREWEQAQEERKAKLKAKVDELKDRVHRQHEYLKERANKIHTQNQTKIKALNDKVKNSDVEFEEKVKDHLESLRQKDLEFTQRVESRLANFLRRYSDELEHKAG